MATFPYTLVMRAQKGGMIWQAYQVKNHIEDFILAANATANGFVLDPRPDGYAEETSPNWRESEQWKKCLATHPIPKFWLRERQIFSQSHHDEYGYKSPKFTGVIVWVRNNYYGMFAGHIFIGDKEHHACNGATLHELVPEFPRDRISKKM